MSMFFVFITCDMGFEKSIIDELKTINSVKDVKGVMGIYDILVKLKSNNSDDLKNIITSKIRKIPNIITTLSVAVVESQD